MSRPPKTSPIEVRTPRLRLVAIDAELARLQWRTARPFSNALGAQVEAAWPPVADDEPKLIEKLELLTRHPNRRAGGAGSS
jgi:ribosomal-protein-alanine N-acetyltransferase